MKKSRYHTYLNSLSSIFPKGGFKQNFVFSFSSKAYIIILSLAFTPIFSRIYTPDAYGYFSVLNIFITHFTLLSTLSFPDTMFVINRDNEFKKLMKLSLWLLSGTSIIYIIITPFLLNYFFNISLEKDGTLSMVLFIAIPIIMSLLNILNKNINYYNDFKFGSIQQIISNSVIRVSGLLIGLFSPLIGVGLMLGELSGRIITLFSYSLKYIPRLKTINIDEDGGATFKKYFEYPKYNLPSRYISIFLSQIILIYVGSNFNIDDLGYLSMSMGLINYPLSLLAVSLGPVFIRRVRDLENESEIALLINKIYVLLVVILIPFVTILLFAAPNIFAIFLGEQWRQSGIFTSILAINLIPELIFGVYGVLYQQKKRLHSLFIVNVIFLVLFGVIYFILNNKGLNIYFVIWMFSILHLIHSVVKSIILFNYFNAKFALSIHIIIGVLFLGYGISKILLMI